MHALDIKRLLVDLFVEEHARAPKQIILDLDATRPRRSSAAHPRPDGGHCRSPARAGRAGFCGTPLSPACDELGAQRSPKPDVSYQIASISTLRARRQRPTEQGESGMNKLHSFTLLASVVGAALMNGGLDGSPAKIMGCELLRGWPRTRPALATSRSANRWLVEGRHRGPHRHHKPTHQLGFTRSSLE
jgi:hypothetical protein